MRHRTSKQCYTLLLLLSLFIASTFVACDRTQTVSITAEDFQFAPQVVTVSSASPLVLTLYQNAEKDRQRRSRLTQRLNVRRSVRIASSLTAALLDGLFAHPASLFRTVSYFDMCDG